MLSLPRRGQTSILALGSISTQQPLQRSFLGTTRTAEPSVDPLTKDYIQKAFDYLGEIRDTEKRNTFFKDYVVDNVKWEVTGNGHSLAGIRNSLAEHNAVSFAKMRLKIKDPIRFVVRSIILEPDTRTACVELRGYATRINGKPYDNDYVWVTYWNKEGKIISVRNYHDTYLAEEVLNED